MNNDADCTDRLGYIAELREALTRDSRQVLFPAAAPLSCGGRWDQAMQAMRVVVGRSDLLEDAFEIVSTLGLCRLYGIEVPEDMQRLLGSPLPAELVVSSVLRSLQLLQTADEEARTLPARLAGVCPDESRSHCASLIHQLTELWAAFVVINGEYSRHLDDPQSLNVTFSLLMDQLLAAFNKLDDSLQQDEQLRLLSVVTELQLLDNFRKMLAPPFNESYPWWLDGTLEALAVQQLR